MSGTRVSDIRGAVPGPDNVQARAALQGTQFAWGFSADDDAAVDTTGWTMTAQAEFYLAHVSESGDGIAVTEFQPDGSTPARALVVAAVDALLGQWEIQVPADLYPGDIPLNIEIDVPVAAICVTMNDNGMTPDPLPIRVSARGKTRPPRSPQHPTIARRRFVIVLRRGW